MAYKFQFGEAILSGALLQEGDVEIESGFNFKMGSTSITEAEIGVIDGVTAGTVAASKAVVVDANKDADGFRNLSGSTLLEFGAATLSSDVTVGEDVILSQGGNVYLAGDGGSAKILSSGGNAVSIFGAKAVFNGSSIEPDSDAGTDLGSSTKEFKDLYIDGVAYIDSLQADQLGAALDANSQAITNINVDSGAIDGTVIGANSAAAGTFAALAGTTGTFSGALSGSSKLEIGGTVRLDGVADAALDVAADSFYFLDGDSLVKRDTMADYATAIAGDGLAASSGVLAVQVHGNGGIELASDALQMNIDGMDALGGATIDQADEFAFSDAGTVKKVTFSNLEDTIFGNVSGDATVAAGGALTIAADAVQGSMLNDDVISAQTELAADGLAAADELLISDGGTLKKIGVDNLFLDGPALLGEEAVAVGSDYIMFLDGGATGDAKKESIADLVSAMAGAGLSAASGVLAVQGNSVHLKANGDTLQEGYNYFADIGDSDAVAAVSLPASPSVGDVVTVKAGNLGSDKYVRISRQGSHTIDGETSIDLESPFAAVTLVYVVADNWRVV